MRIALIDPSLFTLPYDVALAGGLAGQGHDVSLHGRKLTPEDGSAGGVAVRPSFYTVAGSNPVRRLPKTVRLAIKGVDHAASMLRLRRVLGVERPDVIHFQWLPLPWLDRRMLRGFASIAPLVLTVHDTDPFNGSPTAKLQSLGFVASLLACDRLIVHTAQGQARLVAQGVPDASIARMPHGPLAAPSGDGAADPMTGVLTFVLFGKIKPYKGADLLIEAFGMLPEELRRQARVRIVGQPYMDLGPLEAAIARLGVGGQVRIEARFVEDSEIGAIFPPASLAVFPYREIEASGVLSLALAHGRPVIASRLGSFAETIVDGVQGRLLPPGDVRALAAALRQAIEDRACAAAFAREAGRLAGALPGWDEIARMTTDAYRDAARANRARGGAPMRVAPQPVRV